MRLTFHSSCNMFAVITALLLSSCLNTSPLESKFKPEPAVAASQVVSSSSSLTLSSSSLEEMSSSSLDESSSSIDPDSSASLSSSSVKLPAAIVLSLTYDGPEYKGTYYSSASKPKTDYGFWIETADGRYVKTLYVNKGLLSTKHLNMEKHLPRWYAKTGIVIQSLDAQGIKSDSVWLDGISGASVLISAALTSNTVKTRWDFTDSLNIPVATGNYRFCAEVANIEKNAATTEVPVPAVYPFSDYSCGSIAYNGIELYAAAQGTTHILTFTAITE